MGNIKDIWDEEIKFRIEVIESVMPDSGLVLDIGAGIIKYDTKNCFYVTLDVKCDSASVKGDAEHIPFKDEYFDLVIATEVIEHITNPKNMIDEVWRVLKKDGKWLMSTPNVATLMNRIAFMFFGRFPSDRTFHENEEFGHIHFWGKEFLLDALPKNGFKIIGSWNKFFQITPKRYITGSLTDRIFKNFSDQNLYLCQKI